VTKVVTFGAFVEILDGVEGLVHISELAQHHVENPREIIQPGDPVRVKILEIDSERRRLSLSIKRVEGQVLPVRPITPPAEGDGSDLDDVPELGLSEDVFAPAGAGSSDGTPDAGAEVSPEAVVEAGEATADAAPEAAVDPDPFVDADALAEAAPEPGDEAVPAEDAAGAQEVSAASDDASDAPTA
jgi:small subunit ribosomal protein S1